MGIFEELIISLVKPQSYYKLKNESLVKIFRFQMIITFIGFIFLSLLQFIQSLFNKSLTFYKNIEPLNMISTLIYMWLGILTASLFISFIFYLIDLFKKIDHLKFKDLYNYATHTLTICVFLGSFFGPFVIFFPISYYLLAVKGEKIKIC